MRPKAHIEGFSILSVVGNPGPHWFCFTSLCDWSRKLAPLFQPIRCKTETNHDLVACVFPRFRQFASMFSLWVFTPWYFSFFSLVIVITLVLVLRQLINKRSKISNLLCFSNWNSLLSLASSRVVKLNLHNSLDLTIKSEYYPTRQSIQLHPFHHQDLSVISPIWLLQIFLHFGSKNWLHNQSNS